MSENRTSYYKNVAPISVERHRTLSVERVGYSFAKQLDWVPLLKEEFRDASREFLIAFSVDQEVPAVVLGLQQETNLYVDRNGVWEGNYVPAHIRRYPFVFSGALGGSELIFSIDEGAECCNFENRGLALFSAAGEATTFLQESLQFVVKYGEQYEKAREFYKRLRKLKLLEPATFESSLASGKTHQLQGLVQINRARLMELEPSVLHELFRTEELELIYIHLGSLENGDVLQRRRGLSGGGTVGWHDQSMNFGLSQEAAEASGKKISVADENDQTNIYTEGGGDLVNVGAMLQREFARLRCPYRVERSMRFAPGQLFSDRALFGVDRVKLDSTLVSQFEKLTQSLGLPDPYQARSAEHLKNAVALHLGYESASTGVTYKLYFEYPTEPRTSDDAQVNRLKYKAYKWSPSTRTCFTSRYEIVNPASFEHLLDLISDFYDSNLHEESVEIATGLVRFASKKIDISKVEFLEVSDGKTARKSYDINFYNAQLRIKDIHEHLLRIATHFKTQPSEFDRFSRASSEEVFGHLGGGIHRNGEPFFNLYFGAG